MTRPKRRAPHHARAVFISMMTAFGSAQLLLKERMRSDQFAGLGPLHLRLLCLCAEQPGCTQQQLANLMGRDKGQVAHLIHAMENRGLLARMTDSEDGRILRMAVTESGGGAANAFMALEADVAAELFDGLGPEDLRQLQTLTDKLQLRDTDS